MIKVGSFVRYLNDDSDLEAKRFGVRYYPPKGTIGKVEEIEDESFKTCKVSWPEELHLDGDGYVRIKDVEEVETRNGWLMHGIFKDIAKCPFCLKTNVTFVYADNFHHCPFCGKKVN